MRKRVLTSLILFIAILFLPYWAYLPLLLLAIVIFPVFWEGILFGFLIDALYGQSLEAPFFSPIALTALILVIIIMPVRERIRLHA